MSEKRLFANIQKNLNFESDEVHFYVENKLYVLFSDQIQTFVIDENDAEVLVSIDFGDEKQFFDDSGRLEKLIRSGQTLYFY